MSYIADIAVSRLSVCKMKEATSIVNKLIKYEMSPGPGEISDTLLMCGNFLYDVDTIPLSPGDTIYVSDSQKYNEELYQDHIAPYWSGSRMRFLIHSRILRKEIATMSHLYTCKNSCRMVISL